MIAGAEGLRILVVLFSSGLGPRDVVSFHEHVAKAERDVSRTSGRTLALELGQIDRPLTVDDFRQDAPQGRLRLDPAAVAQDLERRGVDAREYAFILAYFKSFDAAPLYALALERSASGVHVSVAAGGSASLGDALERVVSSVEIERARDESRGPPDDGSRFVPLYSRVVISAGNRNVFLPFRGHPPANTRLRLNGRTAPLEPLRVEGNAFVGAWIDLPLGEASLRADAAEGIVIIDRARVGYVEALWRQVKEGALAILEADVREEALGGSLRVPKAKLAVKADDERIVLREFPGGMHMGQRAEGPRPVEVTAEVRGWRIKSALARGVLRKKEAGDKPSGTWIDGEERE